MIANTNILKLSLPPGASQYPFVHCRANSQNPTIDN